jgi:hypothetical protein
MSFTVISPIQQMKPPLPTLPPLMIAALASVLSCGKSEKPKRETWGTSSGILEIII